MSKSRLREDSLLDKNEVPALISDIEEDKTNGVVSD